MRVSVTDGQAQLAELVRRTEAGEEVVLTRDGRATVRLVPVIASPGRHARRAALQDFWRKAAGKVTPGPEATRSQDFLYDDDGLPG
jgi:prevent-host-death family protein